MISVSTSTLTCSVDGYEGKRRASSFGLDRFLQAAIRSYR